VEGFDHYDMRLKINILIVAMACSAVADPASAGGKKVLRQAGFAVSEPAVLWRDPSDLATRDLFYGPGGHSRAPHGVFTFIKEDLDGTNPKFSVKDQDGVKWKVKLGEEAQPETVATRFLWAMGYFADEDYYLPELQVRDMPSRLGDLGLSRADLSRHIAWDIGVAGLGRFGRLHALTLARVDRT
jgi:hypothetical protein